MNLRNRQQLLVAVAVGAVAIFAAEPILFTPVGKAWSSRRIEIARVRRSVQDGETTLRRAAGIRASWQTMRSNALPTTPSVAENEMLKAAERWSRDSRVGINAIKPRWNPVADDHGLLECRIDAFGNLGALSRLLYNIERDPLAVKIDAVEIAARDDRGEQLTLGLQLSGLVLQPARAK